MTKTDQADMIAIENTVKNRAARIEGIAREAVQLMWVKTPPSPRYARAVTQLLCMVWAHESDCGRHARQMGFKEGSTTGAAGEFQMEFLALKDCIAFLKKNDELCRRAGCFIAGDPFQIPRWIYYGEAGEWYRELVLNDRWAAVCARIYLLMDPAPVPESLDGQAEYAKRVWNTKAGKATPALYKKKFLEAFGKELPA